MRRIYFSLILVCFSLLTAKVFAQTTTFNYTGSVQTFTVPAGCTSIIADVAGAAGGTYPSPVAAGGLGGRAQGTIAVTPGQVLQIYVGAAGVNGSCGAGGSNSGGGAQGGTGGCSSGGAGGGGSSDIRTSAGVLTSRLMVGGGGGGGAWNSGGEYGGGGGGLTGGLGSAVGTSGWTAGGCGGPGTQIAGGAAGTSGAGATAGGLGFGGNGTFFGGGGGGGYYGAGGAYAGGGCGGSSFIGGTGVTGGTTTTGFRSGNGYVAITPILSGFSATPSSLSFGGVSVGSNSAAQSFVLTGASLTGFPGNVTVTAPSGYEVSIEGTLWFSSLTVPYTSATLAANTIYVRFNPIALGVLCGNVAVTGGGLPTYNVNVCGTGANVCTGTPTAGTASITPTTGTSATTFNLSLTGTTTAGGLTYQWKSAPALTGPYTDVTGATGPTYSTSGLGATTYFRCDVTCPSFAVASSNTVSATVTLAAPACIGASGDPVGSCVSYAMYHLGFNMTGASGTISDAAGCNSTGYLDRTALSCTINAGTTYTANVTAGSANQIYNQIWIDFNGDGTFSSTETVGGNATAHYGLAAITLTIPPTATPGTYRMRSVISWYGTALNYPSLSPCQTGHNYGEARDYTVIIAPSCSNPPAITGTNFVCFPGTTTLANATGGGTWSSSNTAIATVAGGVVTGVAAGGANITYTVTGGCRVTRPVGVYAKPSVASVTPSATTLCANSSFTLTAGAVTGSAVSYTWSGPASYSSTSVINAATVTPTSTAGSGSYSVTATSSAGCVSNPVATASITVNVSPAPFSGAHTLCQAGSTTLSNTVTGGTWTGTPSSLVTVAPVTGAVTGLSAGIASITYTLPNTCSLVEAVSVNPLPAVTVTPPGPTTICMGNSTSFTASSPNPSFALLTMDFNAGLGGWTMTRSAGAAANWWQIVTPSTSTGGISGDGSAMLQAAANSTLTSTVITSPSFSTVGYGSAILSFNEFLLSASPDSAARIEYSTNGGTSWTLLADHALTVVGSGVWSSASPETSITLPAGALGQADIKVRFYYAASQFYWFLDNIRVNASLPASTYSWTGALGLSCTTCTNPTITPTSTGANNYSITVTTSAGCTTTNGVVVSVNPLPGTITGNLNVCVGTTFTLANSATGGTWISSDPTKATIVAGTGAMTGVAVGTTTITYTLPTGCYMTAVANVAAAPAAITGNTAVCTGLTTGLSHAVTGGTWVSSNTVVAGINSFGLVSGLTAGTTSITYTLPSGCITSRTETVNATPNGITGTQVVCQGATTALSSTTPAGTWVSGTTSVATISPSGVVSGVSGGFSLVSYTVTLTGCKTTAMVTVNSLPVANTGATNVCVGSSAIVTNATGGGTWSSVFPSVASVDAAGIVTGFSAGNTVLSYIITGTGCGISSSFTVNPLPSTISGVMEVCKDGTTGLTSSPASGTWTSSSPTTLSIDPSSGIATGMAAGNATVTYQLPTGCKQTTGVQVDPLPLPISGTARVCYGQTTPLYDFTPGGVWSSGNTGIADVSPTGVVTGMGAGMAQITYMNATTGCLQTIIATVDPLPGAITGIFQVCVGQTTLLGNPDAGGTWNSSNNGLATVSASGLVSGVAQGAVTISYTLPTGCVQTQAVNVNPLPGSLTGTGSVCEGQMITWTNASPGGLWTSEVPGTASIDAMGVITGGIAGTTNITYTLPTGCMRSRIVNVNQTPTAISGTPMACVGQTSTLGSTPSGGVWSTGSSVIAPVSNAGVVSGATAGMTNITYTLPAGCKTTTSFIVNALPTAISGSTNVCEGSTTTLTSATATNWASGNTAVATVNAFGVVNGISAGTTMITCFTASGCERSITVNVKPLPAPIFGILNVCAGSATTLSDATPGGVWTSSSPSIATITSSGVVIGASAGVSNITYTLPTTCKSTASVVVNALPAAISGASAVCSGSSIALSNSTGGGNWQSSNPAVASVDGVGMVTGGISGTSLISYVLSTGCQKTMMVQVNPLPSAIAGNTNICMGNGTLLASSTPGGTWSSSDMGVLTINPTTGAAFGATPGFSIVTYTLPTSCKTTASVIVNGLPEVITGTASVCAGSVTQLDDITPGGTWSSASSVAMVDATGLVTGVAAGTTTITYATGNNCFRRTTVTVNALPTLIYGNAGVCTGLTTVLSNATPDGTWSSDNTLSAPVGASSGIVSGMSIGTANITYTLPTGCMRSKMVTVHPSVEAITGTMSVCKGAMTTLGDVSTGGVWMSGNTTVATVTTSTGDVTGINAGTALVTYALPTGCMATTTIMVNGLPTSITGAVSVCEGATTPLANGVSGGSWSSSDDAIAMIDNTTGVVMGMSAGTATMTYALGTGCMKTRDITVNALPMSQNVTGGGAYCAGGAGMSVGLDGSEGTVNYALMLGTGTVMNMSGTELVLDFGMKTAAGVYTVRATSAAGCMLNMNGSATITITPLTVPSVSLSSSDTVCSSSAVTYTATGTNGGTPTYSWSVGTSTVGTGATYSYTPVNGDVVKVTMTSTAACPSVTTVSASKTMVVIPTLTPSANITVGPDDTVCQGSMAAFMATTTNGGTSPSYTWVVGGAIVTGATNSTYAYTPTNGQTVVCKINSNYRCPSVNNVSSNTITMHVDPQYIPVVSIIAQPGTVVSAGQMVTFTTQVTGGGPAPRYQWLIRGGAIQGATQPTFSSNDLNDGDSVTCVVYGTGACGLATINSVVMKVTPSTGVGTMTMLNGDIRLVPNPNNGTFVVSGTTGTTANEAIMLEVTDMLGQVVYKGTTAAHNGVLNQQVQLSNNLANGMYMLNISTANDHKVLHFVVKQ